MKKLLAAVLAAMFLFSTAALAETTANPQDRFLLICFEDAGTQTYALLGAGDGTQAFNAFAPKAARTKPASPGSGRRFPNWNPP